MPNFTRPGIPDLPGIDDAADSALLGGTELPPAAAGLQPVADLLASLRAAPAGDELAGEASALAAFRAGQGVPAAGPGSSRRRRYPLASRMAARAAVAAVVAVFSLGGAAVGAYAGALPGPIQRFAHVLIGAPDAAPSRRVPSPGPGTAVGPRPGDGSPASRSHAVLPSSRYRGKHSSAPANRTPKANPSPSVHPKHPRHPKHPKHPQRPKHPQHSKQGQDPQGQGSQGQGSQGQGSQGQDSQRQESLGPPPEHTPGTVHPGGGVRALPPPASSRHAGRPRAARPPAPPTRPHPRDHRRPGHATARAWPPGAGVSG
jgi:hypothetical protein